MEEAIVAAPPMPKNPVPERAATVWVSRLTFALGVLTLIAALATWAGREGHYRFVLALLIVAMFAAILHSYTCDA
jgi:hypothetical protein